MHDQDVYTVGYTDSYIPVSYHVNGRLTGISVDILNEIADELDVHLEYYDLDDPATDKASLDIDLQIINFDERQLSDPLATYPSLLATKTTFTGQIEKVSARYDFGLSEYDRALVGKEVIFYDTFDEAKMAMDNGEVDALLMSSIGYEKVSTEYELGIYEFEAIDTPVDIRMAYNEDFPQEKIEIINKLIGMIDPQELTLLRQIHSNYVERTYTTLDQIYANMDILGTGMFVGVCIMAGLLLFWQHSKRKKTEYMLSHDVLTGLMTVDKFRKEVKRHIEENKDEKLHILAVDMDNFKYINEIYGFEVGTEIIKELGIGAKEMPNIYKDTICRTFGDGFLVLLTGDDVVSRLTGSEDSYERLKQRLSLVLGEEYNFSFSIGIYSINDTSHSVNLMVDCAIAAKNRGKNVLGYTVYQYTDEMRQIRKNQNKIIASMNTGVKNKEFVMYYQVKTRLSDNAPIGAEALVRWIKDGKIVPPNDFIPLFEQNGFIEILDYYVLGEVCNFIKENQDKDLPIISINLSGITAMKSDLVENIVRIVNEYGVKSSQIDLEITESALVQQSRESISRLEELRTKGYTLSMDDFGAGVSSLNQLREIPLDTLKIDRAFIMNSIDTKKGGAIVENIINLAKNIDLETVAEGIETIEQLEFLKERGCYAGQGYYFSRPLPEDEFLTLLNRMRKE